MQLAVQTQVLSWGKLLVELQVGGYAAAMEGNIHPVDHSIADRELDAARIRSQQSTHDLDQRRLPTTIRPNHGTYTPRAERAADIAYDLSVTVALADVL